MAGKCSDACYCRNLTCGIVFLTVGTLSVVAGGIIAAVGFGTRPKDMFDTQNLSMRVAGLCLAGIGILPIIMGAMFLVFYCAYKRGEGPPGQKKSSQKSVEMAVIAKPNVGQNEYPYPKDGSPLISKPQSIPDDSFMKYDDYGNDGHYSVPVNESGRLSTDGLVNPPVYSEIKAPAPHGTNKTTTTTVTKTYKTEHLDGNTGSGSSGVTFRSETLPEMKAKRKKKKEPLPGNEIAIGSSLSSEVHSFDDSSVLPHQKSTHMKKSKRNGPLASQGDEVFEETDEPLPDGRYHSHGNGGNSRHQQTAQAHHSGTSPSFEQNSDSPPEVVYGKVKKSRNKKV